MWEGIKGHSYQKRVLERYLEAAKVPHCLLFSGVSGVGKKMMALEFAQALTCKIDQGYCGRCVDCRQWGKGMIHYDSQIFEGNVKILIDDVRKLKNRLQKSGLSGGYRVVIIDEIARMTNEAVNAFLKLLEEPNKKIVFIIIATDIDSVFDTIVSRSVVLKFDRLSNEDIENWLGEIENGFGRGEIVTMLMGRPGTKDRFLSVKKDNHLTNVQMFWRLLLADFNVRFGFIKKINQLGPDRLEGLLFFWESCLRDYLLWKNEDKNHRWWHDSKIDKIYQSMMWPKEATINMIEKISFFRDNLNKGLNKKIQLTEIFIY